METKPSVPKAESNDDIKETLLSNDALEKIAGGETSEEFRQRVANAKDPAERALILASAPLRYILELSKESKE
ncbi:hypothetical protein ABC383_11985 [Noviherbaspirillum sp. 1P10PC]|uniref:hypothetical protein n=1 Tax=Noviherbaspirillum sp. 1P10PC TaxID=3132292 RepID=UPI0039A379DB